MGRRWVLAVVIAAVWGIDANPPTYDIDLDQPAETRWVSVLRPYALTIRSVYSELLSGISTTEIHYFSLLLQTTFLDEELKAELQSAANVTGVSMDKVVALSFFYELNAFCTSIVIRVKGGEMLHGRNLDYVVPASLRSLVANINFHRSGVLLYRATTILGYFGILTAVKPGAFAVSLDQRKAGGAFFWNVVAAIKGNVGNTIAVRRAMETAGSYQQAVDYLSATMLVTESYYILSSPSHEAAVITRLRDAPADVYPLSSSKWYIVETNYDHWRSDPAQDPRKTYAEEHLESIGKGNVGAEEVWRVLSTRPVFRDNTIHTTLMSAKTGELTSLIRNVKPHEEFS